MSLSEVQDAEFSLPQEQDPVLDSARSPPEDNTHSFLTVGANAVPLDSKVFASDTLTQAITEKSLSVLGHNHLGQVVFSCSNLKGLGLVDISRLSGYRFLQKIILDQNKLQSLEALQNLQYLVYLSATDNMLTDGCFDCLRSSSANLEHLQLNNNQLTSLNGLEQLPYLINFSAAHNKITKLTAENFSTLKSLMRVQLRGNCIEKVEPQTFYGAQHIRLLDLSHNKVEDMLFTAYITENLEALYLSDNSISRVGRSMAQCQSLVLLDIKNNRIDTIEELQNICPAPGLRKLYINGNPFKEIQEEHSDDLGMDQKQLSRSEITMEDSGYHAVDYASTINSDRGTEACRKGLKSPNVGYAALTARHTYGRIKSIVAASNVVRIPSRTDKLGELHRMPLATQARLRVLNFLPQLSILNGVLVTPEDVARSIAYFEEEKSYFLDSDGAMAAPRAGGSVDTQPGGRETASKESTSVDSCTERSQTQDLKTPPHDVYCE